MVEARGIEPLSKGPATKLSPSASSHLNFALRPPADKLSNAIPKNFPVGPPGVRPQVSRYVSSYPRPQEVER